MVQQTTINLKNLRLGSYSNEGNRSYTMILTNTGHAVGKFVTVGHGYREHLRRLKAVIKKDVKDDTTP